MNTFNTITSKPKSQDGATTCVYFMQFHNIHFKEVLMLVITVLLVPISRQKTDMPQRK